MRKPLFLIITCLILSSIVNAQKIDSISIIHRNQLIDDLVVQHNTSALDSLYADDFIFSHGSGRVEGKEGWFTSVVKGSFISRKHDSVRVELHPGIAIVKGKLSVQKQGKENIDKYYLYYIRIYALRKKSWQLISHSTTHEFHELIEIK